MSSGPGPFVLDEHGYFRNAAGNSFVAYGVNYWPGSAGVEMWQAWPEREIQKDLDLVCSLGLDSVRFFLRWQDFEPEAGRYDAPSFARLDKLLSWCSERGLLAHPSLFVGWMSGGTFWPAWFRGRNVFSDPELIERGRAFASRTVESCARHARQILAWDLGNELDCVPDARRTSSQAVGAWCSTLCGAIRAKSPRALIVSGTSAGVAHVDGPWQLENQPDTDLLSVHLYPVPSWHPIRFDGMTDSLGHAAGASYVKMARACGPVMVQEFGTLLTHGAEQQDAYLRALLPRCLQAGANGFMWWCLRDVHSRAHPYPKSPFETQLGLVDDQGAVKPGLEAFLEFARDSRLPRPKASCDVALYLPHHRAALDERNPGNLAPDVAARLAVAEHALSGIGQATQVVRELSSLPAEVVLMVCGACLDERELEELCAWVERGGRLLLHGINPFGMAAAGQRLVGALPVDFRSPEPCQLDAGGCALELGSYLHGVRVELAERQATVLQRDPQGVPLVLENALGSGHVRSVVPLVEDAVRTSVAARERVAALYRSELDALARVRTRAGASVGDRTPS